jgi:hypothetical protein
VNVTQQSNGQPPTQRDHAKPKGHFTGQRLKVLRPETYRRVMELLAEPREQVAYDHICRLLRVSEHTVKAIEKTESASIAERKQRLLTKALRIANKAADRIEDQIDGANITQATVAFGVATEKMLLTRTCTSRIRSSQSIFVSFSTNLTTRSLLKLSKFKIPSSNYPPSNWHYQAVRRFLILVLRPVRTLEKHTVKNGQVTE